MGQGDTVAHVGASNLTQTQIGILRLTEQSAIAAFLSDMDAEIAALECCRDKTRAIKRCMTHERLTGSVRLVKPEAVTKQVAQSSTSDRGGVRFKA